MTEEKKFEVHAEIVVNLTSQDVDDIMASALDSGISYWCAKAEVVGEYLGEFASDQISRGGALKLYDSTDGKAHELDIEKFTQGFRVWLEKGYDKYHAVGGGEVDTCNIDAECADGIVQCALFDDIIYG